MGASASVNEGLERLRALADEKGSKPPATLESAIEEISSLRGALKECTAERRFREQAAVGRILERVNLLPPWATLRETAEVYRTEALPELLRNPAAEGTVVLMSEALLSQESHDSNDLHLVTGDPLDGQKLTEAVRLSELALERGEPSEGGADGAYIMAVPLFTDEVDGFGATIVLWHQGGVCFNADEVKSLSGVLDLTGMLLLRRACSIRAQSELSQEHELLESLLQVAKILFKNNTDLMGTLDAVMEHVHSILSVDRVSIFIKDEKTSELWCKTLSASSGFRVPLNIKKPSIAAYVAHYGEPLNISDAYQDERFDPKYDKANNYRTKTILCLPILNERSKTVGVIQAVNKMELDGNIEDAGPFTDHDQNLLATVCEELGCVMNTKSLEAIYAMADEGEAENEDLHAMLAMYSKAKASTKNAATPYQKNKRLFSGSDGATPPSRSPSTVSTMSASINKVASRIMVEGEDGEATETKSTDGAQAGAPAPITVKVSSRQAAGSDVVECKTSEAETVPLSMNSIRLPPKPGIDALDDVREWSFNPFDRDEDELVMLTEAIFWNFDIVETFGLQRHTFLNFVKVVKDNYLPNPYHNWQHGFGVLHGSFMVLTNTAAREFLKPDDLLGLLLGSICHDLGHPGTNNKFQTEAHVFCPE